MTEWLGKQNNVAYNEREKAFYFKMVVGNNICGIIKVTQEEEILIDGSRRGLLEIGEIDKSNRIVILENPIDMSYYKELGRGKKEDFYLCTMGASYETIKENLEEILDHSKGIPFILAFGNNETGEQLIEKVSRMIKDRCEIRRDKPTTSNWVSEFAKKKKQGVEGGIKKHM